MSIAPSGQATRAPCGGPAGGDILVGGDGTDRLVGSAGQDILVACEVNPAYTVAELRAILAKWVGSGEGGRITDFKFKKKQHDETTDSL